MAFSLFKTVQISAAFDLVKRTVEVLWIVKVILFLTRKLSAYANAIEKCFVPQ